METSGAIRSVIAVVGIAAASPSIVGKPAVEGTRYTAQAALTCQRVLSSGRPLMITRRGIAVSPGVAIGPAFVFGAEEFRIAPRRVSEQANTDSAIVESEVQRFHQAVASTVEELEGNEAALRESVGEQYAAIFGAHRMMVRDPKLNGEIESLIRDRHFTPEYAVTSVFRKFADRFRNLPSAHLAERANDVLDLEKRLVRHLLGTRHEEIAQLTEPVILLAANLTPSETAGLPREHVRGFATETGGRTSHTAILAGALELPAVVGCGPLLRHMSGGETVIIDGNGGQVVIDPDDETLERYQSSRERLQTVAQQLERLRDVEACTKCGVRVELSANIEFPHEAKHCRELGADGIGLYRTEFLYLGQARERSEAEHMEAYREVIEAMDGRPVTIRTLDLGADKVGGAASDHLVGLHQNPELGLRSIRLSLDNVPLFKTQLRAILRAAVYAPPGAVRVMFPLVSSLMELRRARMLVQDVAEELQDEGLRYAVGLPIGMMVEVPAVAVLASDFAREADFLSIGTNDLIQYTLAADRSDPSVAKFYNSAHPAILRMIFDTVEAANDAAKPVSLCGQMSSDLKFIPLLIGMGLRSLSCTPQVIPEVKEMLRHLTVERAEKILEHARTLDLARDIEFYLRSEAQKICPELMQS